MWAFISLISSTLDNADLDVMLSQRLPPTAVIVFDGAKRSYSAVGEMQNGPNIKMTSITLIVFSPVSRQSVFVSSLLAQTLPKRELHVTGSRILQDQISPILKRDAESGKGILKNHNMLITVTVFSVPSAIVDYR